MKVLQIILDIWLIVGAIACNLRIKKLEDRLDRNVKQGAGGVLKVDK